jgi:hypothetical protein
LEQHLTGLSCKLSLAGSQHVLFILQHHPTEEFVSHTHNYIPLGFFSLMPKTEVQATLIQVECRFVEQVSNHILPQLSGEGGRQQCHPGRHEYQLAQVQDKELTPEQEHLLCFLVEHGDTLEEDIKHTKISGKKTWSPVIWSYSSPNENLLEGSFIL